MAGAGAAADAADADLIVVGSHGHGHAASRVWGGLSYRLAHMARQPVVVVPPTWRSPTPDASATEAEPVPTTVG